MTLEQITALVGTDKKVRVTGPSCDCTGVIAEVKSPPPPGGVVALAFPGMQGVGLDTDDGRKMMIMFPDPLYTGTELSA
jgi:hypothetical protein